ncbi:uncharacterized protein LOC126735944 [Anthonomus grandis grandis]|uniref:uncharacterized protein LOC126735944 n=1 Tax=Anthonomus grandis grandis TaxID=2921223 RepID=UPI002165D30B|nr:uncharacterized protein LOC126735944 [Anthonomus grandis grandis]
MKPVIWLAAAVTLATASPSGYYRQEYNYQASSSAYKNNELQHKTDDQGYYSKAGDLEGRTRPKVSSNSEHSEYINPKISSAGYHDSGLDLSSQGTMLAQGYGGHGGYGGSLGGSISTGYGYDNELGSEGLASSNYIGGVSSGSSGYQGSYSSGSDYSSFESANLRSIANRLQNDLQHEIQSAMLVESHQANIAELESELRRNLSARLTTMLNDRFGPQAIRSGQSYSLVSGRFEARPNYEQHELEQLQRQLENSLMQQLRREYQQRSSHHTSYNQQNYDRYESTTTYRPTTYRTTTYRSVYPNLNTITTENKYMGGYGGGSHHESVHSYNSESTNVQYTQAPNVISITTVASNVQRDLNEQLNRILDDARRQYFSENARLNTINTGAILEQLKQDLRHNLTYTLEEELRRHFGNQVQRNGYMFSVGSGQQQNQYNYNVADLENLKRQVEENLLTKLARDFESARQHWVSRQQQTQTHQDQYYSGSSGYNYGGSSSNMRTDYVTPRPVHWDVDDYQQPTAASIVPLISSGVKGGHQYFGASGSQYAAGSSSSSSNYAQLERELQSDLSNQLQAALSQYVSRQGQYSSGYSASQRQASMEEAFRRLNAELQRNLTEQLQSFQSGHSAYSGSYGSSVNDNQLAQLRSELQNSLASQLQQGLQQSYSASASYSASSSSSSGSSASVGAGAGSYSSGGGGGGYYRAARGSNDFEYGQMGLGSGYHVEGDGCQGDSPYHHYRGKRSYGYRSRPLGLSSHAGVGYNSRGTYGGYSGRPVDQDAEVIQPNANTIGQEVDDSDTQQVEVDPAFGVSVAVTGSGRETGQEVDESDTQQLEIDPGFDVEAGVGSVNPSSAGKIGKDASFGAGAVFTEVNGNVQSSIPSRSYSSSSSYGNRHRSQTRISGYGTHYSSGYGNGLHAGQQLDDSDTQQIETDFGAPLSSNSQLTTGSLGHVESSVPPKSYSSSTSYGHSYSSIPSRAQSSSTSYGGLSGYGSPYSSGHSAYFHRRKPEPSTSPANKFTGQEIDDFDDTQQIKIDHGFDSTAFSGTDNEFSSPGTYSQTRPSKYGSGQSNYYNRRPNYQPSTGHDDDVRPGQGQEVDNSDTQQVETPNFGIKPISVGTGIQQASGSQMTPVSDRGKVNGIPDDLVLQGTANPGGVDINNPQGGFPQGNFPSGLDIQNQFKPGSLDIDYLQGQFSGNTTPASETDDSLIAPALRPISDSDQRAESFSRPSKSTTTKPYITSAVPTFNTNNFNVFTTTTTRPFSVQYGTQNQLPEPESVSPLNPLPVFSWKTSPKPKPNYSSFATGSTPLPGKPLVSLDQIGITSTTPYSVNIPNVVVTGQDQFPLSTPGREVGSTPSNKVVGSVVLIDELSLPRVQLPYKLTEVSNKIEEKLTGTVKHFVEKTFTSDNRLPNDFQPSYDQTLYNLRTSIRAACEKILKDRTYSYLNVRETEVDLMVQYLERKLITVLNKEYQSWINVVSYIPITPFVDSTPKKPSSSSFIQQEIGAEIENSQPGQFSVRPIVPIQQEIEAGLPNSQPGQFTNGPKIPVKQEIGAAVPNPQPEQFTIRPNIPVQQEIGAGVQNLQPGQFTNSPSMSSAISPRPVETVTLKDLTPEQFQLINDVVSHFSNNIQAVEQEISFDKTLDYASKYQLYQTSLRKLEAELRAEISNFKQGNMENTPTNAALQQYYTLIAKQFPAQKIDDVYKYVEIKLIKNLREELKRTFGIEESSVSEVNVPTFNSDNYRKRLEEAEREADALIQKLRDSINNKRRNGIRDNTDRSNPRYEVIQVTLEDLNPEQFQLINDVVAHFTNNLQVVEGEITYDKTLDYTSRYQLYQQNLKKLEADLSKELSNFKNGKIDDIPANTALQHYFILINEKFSKEKIPDVYKYLEIKLIKSLRADLRKVYHIEEPLDSEESTSKIVVPQEQRPHPVQTERRVVKLENLTPVQNQLVNKAEEDFSSFIDKAVRNIYVTTSLDHVSRYEVYQNTLKQLETELKNNVSSCIYGTFSLDESNDELLKLSGLVSKNFPPEKLANLEEYLIVKLRNVLRAQLRKVYQLENSESTYEYESTSTHFKPSKQEQHVVRLENITPAQLKIIRQIEEDTSKNIEETVKLRKGSLTENNLSAFEYQQALDVLEEDLKNNITVTIHSIGEPGQNQYSEVVANNFKPNQIPDLVKYLQIRLMNKLTRYIHFSEHVISSSFSGSSAFDSSHLLGQQGFNSQMSSSQIIPTINNQFDSGNNEGSAVFGTSAGVPSVSVQGSVKGGKAPENEVFQVAFVRGLNVDETVGVSPTDDSNLDDTTEPTTPAEGWWSRMGKKVKQGASKLKQKIIGSS